MTLKKIKEFLEVLDDNQLDQELNIFDRYEDKYVPIGYIFRMGELTPGQIYRGDQSTDGYRYVLIIDSQRR